MDPPTSSGRDDLEMEMQPIVPRGPIDPDGRKITRSNDGNMKMPSRRNRGRNLPRPMATAVAHGQSIMAMVDSDAKKKKMLLVFLCILMAALVGMVAVKGDAVDIEKVVEEGEIEVAHHDDTATGDAESKSSSSSSSSSSAAVHTVDLDGYLPKSMVNASDYVLPGTENAPPLSAAKGRPYYPIINHFQNRNPTGSYAKKWGYFDLEDPDPKWKGKMRPQPDFGAVPNRDVKSTDFPDGAWQKDKEYMTRFLEEAKKLVNRTIEAVYGEWGVGIPQDGSVELTDEFMVNREAFYKWPKPSDQSLDGMTRRFIHHIMTGDSFKLVLGGHSAAAGHGAGFNASYVHQAGLVLEPVFAHLGVEFRSYNFAQGGMGTFQQALAGMDLRGKDADMLIWDSSMTEKSPPLTNFFFRQGLLAGNRAPFLYSGGGANPAAFEAIGASVGGYGELGYSPITTSEEQAKTLPWAARYNKCESGASALCTAQEYDGKCWVEREDFTPEAKQQELVGGQAKWHPGPKKHRSRGRALALSVLFMLQHALDKWEELGTESGYPVAEQYWHVTDFYNSIKEKVPTVEGCYSDDAWKIGQSRRGLRENNQIYGRRLDLEGFWPSRLCNIPMHGRSLWGPRVNPMESSLLSILKPNAYGDVDPNIHDNPDYMKGPDYFPPDRAAPWSTPPEPEVNPWEIAGSRRLQDKAHASNGEQANSGNFFSDTEKEALPSAEEVAKARGTVNATALRILAEDPDAIVPGLGLEVLWGLPGVCDGTTHGWCDKSTTTDCLYSGAQDNRGMICFNPLSGWVVFDVKEVKHGFIGARMESWHKSGDLTKGWNEVNNGGKGNYAKEGLERHLLQKEKQKRDAMYLEEMSHRIEEDMLLEDPSTARRLGGGQSCGASGDYIFEFAINGKIVASWDKDAFCSHYTRTGYNLDLIKFMDDEKMTGDFELAMRMSPTHSNKQGTMCITHLYWG